MNHEELMRRAIGLGLGNIDSGGGPFGAVIASQEGQLIADGTNMVTPLCDPTAHAEIRAIRAACSALGTYNLSGFVIYTSCEPCPMCLGAIYWARLSKVYYACTQADAQAAGFDDERIYREFTVPMHLRELPFSSLLRNEALEIFEKWKSTPDKTPY